MKIKWRSFPVKLSASILVVTAFNFFVVIQIQRDLVTSNIMVDMNMNDMHLQSNVSSSTTPKSFLQNQKDDVGEEQKVKKDGEGEEKKVKEDGEEQPEMTLQQYANLTFDLTGAGARYPNGTFGLIVNPTTQRLTRYNRTKLGIIGNGTTGNAICPSTEYGIEGAGGHKVLEKVKRGVQKSREFLQLQLKAMNDSVVTSDSTKSGITSGSNSNLTSTIVIGENNITARAKRSSILCLVYSTHLPPSYENVNLKAQAETWGSECDGFIAASNYTNHLVGSIDLVHNGPESYSNMWQKVRSIWAYAHKHYRDDFDYFHICGDDVYVVMDNLRAYLDGPEVIQLENGYMDLFSRGYPQWLPEMGPRPLLLGTPTLHKKFVVISGGPGYTMNRAALDAVNEGMNVFYPYAHDSREDIFLARSIQNLLSMSDTRDSNGSKRYGESADFLFSFDGIGPDAPKIFAKALKMPPLPLGIDVVSEKFISFHLKFEKPKLPDLIYRYHALLHDWCNVSE